MSKRYKLLGADGKFYESDTPGQFGGNSKLKIYGRLDCPSALSTIKRFPGSYEKVRVFFCRRENCTCCRISSVRKLPESKV